MYKILTTEEFIEKAKAVHGNKYDYSKVEYVNSRTKVCIICPIHGDFFQEANSHIQGKKCYLCEQLRKRTKVCGIGVNDLDHPLSKKEMKSYYVWASMIRRCYDENELKKRPSYTGCSVCDEWLLFSNFKQWFDENYVDGYQLDKDVIVSKNKIYSPNTCCFVPKEINSVIKRVGFRRDKYIGTTKNYNKYGASISKYGKHISLGYYYNIEDAYLAYKKAKEDYLKELANKYKENISEAVYNALINYKVDDLYNLDKRYEEAHPEEFEEPEEVPMKPNQILLVSVYQVMALNEMCNCCVLDIEPSIKNKDKETKKLFYAAKKRVNWYQKEVNNLTISSGTVYVDFNDSLDLYTKPLLLKYQQALENYLSTIKGVENPYFASLVEVARSMTKLSITEISNRIKECIKFAEDSIALRHYKQKELLDIINNLVNWVFRKAEDINYNDSSECVEAYKNLVDAYQNPNIIGECIIKAQQLNDKEDESKI